MSFFEKLKTRWGITSNWRLVKILLVFSLTGMCAVQIRKFLFPFIGIDDATPTWLYVTLWIILITPAYYIFLLFFSFILGEKEFFWGRMQKTLDRMKGKK